MAYLAWCCRKNDIYIYVCVCGCIYIQSSAVVTAVDTDIDTPPRIMKVLVLIYIKYIPPIISMYGYTCSTFHQIWKQICDFTIESNMMKWSVDVVVCRRFGQSTFWFVDVSVCRRFGLSTFWFVDVLVCRRFGLSTFRFVDVLVCRRFGCRRFGLSTFWPVTIYNTIWHH